MLRILSSTLSTKFITREVMNGMYWLSELPDLWFILFCMLWIVLQSRTDPIRNISITVSLVLASVEDLLQRTRALKNFHHLFVFLNFNLDGLTFQTLK